VITFLVPEGLKPTIHKFMHKVYGVATVNASTVHQWAKQIKEAEIGRGLCHKLPVVTVA
jgi:hypothetical protein